MLSVQEQLDMQRKWAILNQKAQEAREKTENYIHVAKRHAEENKSALAQNRDIIIAGDKKNAGLEVALSNS